MEQTEEWRCGAVNGEESSGRLDSHLSPACLPETRCGYNLTSESPGLLGQHRRKEPPGTSHCATPLSVKKKKHPSVFKWERNYFKSLLISEFQLSKDTDFLELGRKTSKA